MILFHHHVRVLMALSVVDGLKQVCPGRLKEGTEPEPSRVTRPAIRHEVSSQWWRTEKFALSL
jgi:hypothetical protein